MYEYGLPALFAIFVWWFSTGVIIFLDNLPRHTFRWSMLGATVVLVISLYGLSVTAADATVTGAYLAFTFGLLAWGWQQLSFYTGYITGTRKTACPEGCRGWKHFVHAIETCIYHELAIIAAAIVVFWLTWGQPNQVGTWTFMVLWWMHQSAKLNVFLGVRNLNEEFLPEQFEYLKSFLKKRPMNLLFPVSVTVSTVITVMLVQRAIDPSATPFEAVGFTFLSVLMALAILEHWFMVVPLPAAVLWHWGLKSRSARKPSSDAATELKSWSARLCGPYDQRRLRAVMAKIDQGAFGRIERLSGLAPTEAGWLRFDMAGGRASVTAYVPSADEEPRLVVTGQQINEAALEAAFAGCAVMTESPAPVPAKMAAGAVAAE